MSVCRKEVYDGIQCDRCHRWYHRECSKLTKATYKLYRTHKSLKWICGHCVALAEEFSRVIQQTLRLEEQSLGVKRQHATDRGKKENIAEGSRDEKKVKVGPKKQKGNKTKTANTHKGDKGELTNQNIAELTNRIMILEMELYSLKRYTDSYLGRTRNLLIHNCEEPLIKETRIRKELDRRKVYDVLRIAGAPAGLVLRRIHRVGR